MRKYYTIEKTLHTSRVALEKMIACCVGNRKNPEPEKNFPTEKKIFSGQKYSKKKLARRADT